MSHFTELPKDVQERFHYDPAQAAAAQAAAAQAYAAQQTEQLNKQLRDASAAERKHQTEQQGKQRNIQPVQSQNFITIREISADQRKFLHQEILLKGTIDVAAYYNGVTQRRNELTTPSELATAVGAIVTHIWRAAKTVRICISN